MNYINKNRAILYAWLNDSDGDHDAAQDRALCALLNDDLALTPDLARAHAGRWRAEFPHVAELLNALADKLHSVPAQTMPIEMRWQLAQRRAQRLYDSSPDNGLGIADDNIGDCERGAWVFTFGAYGDTHVLAYGPLEDALEDAAAWLEKHAPGHLTEPDYAEAQIELAEEEGSDLGPDELEDAIRERAEADMTYTESGWLLSYEWTFTELHSPADLLTYVNRK